MGFISLLPKLLIVTTLVALVESKSPLIDIGDKVSGQEFNIPNLGSLVGTETVSFWSRRKIYQYQGVPYAVPPVGDLRFKPPQPAPPFKDTWNAMYMRRACPQTVDLKTVKKRAVSNATEPNEEILEDCLFLNIYTPMAPSDSLNEHPTRLLPVMVYIHGGSFKVGSAHSALPNYLLEEDLVFVSIQYRLGPFGFLSLMNDDVPGNMGLMDMVLALKWIRKFIQYFGGDHTKVTLMGNSAGGAAVSLLMASPMVPPGLFHRAIMQSGTAICDWVLDTNPVEHAMDIARHAGCTTTNKVDAARCLRGKSVSEILEAHSQATTNAIATTGVAVRGDYGGNHAVIQTAGEPKFLIEDPKITFENGGHMKIPVLGGTVKHEGSFLLANIYTYLLEANNLTHNSEYLKTSFTRSVLRFLGVEDTVGAVSDLLNQKYFRHDQLGNFTAMIPGMVDICGVLLIKSCVFKLFQMTRIYNETYLYSFNYGSGKRYTKFGHGYPFPGGVSHSDELFYLFWDHNVQLNKEEEEIAQSLVEMWTNFAIYGVPAPALKVPSWPNMDSFNGPYLQIGRSPKVKPEYLSEYEVAVMEGIDNYFNGANTMRLTYMALFLAASVWIIHR
nr:PREDICTED: pyrethroid hydrolase Ces2a-like isoform X2 [Bemisia tabaci]XP_018917078.1 PREDICTED: pyrethroid hydrolase Ces2a-like isoform X2 [Bemisia tabaci]XP_018917079.1 PREDICTED: pyrethroid hydrolase Ces2a-like isoform X2 [Bemisia tabaci]